MQGRLAFCLRASVLSLALFACSTGEPTAPGDPEDPETPPLPATVSWSNGATWPGGQVPACRRGRRDPVGQGGAARREPPTAREPADRGCPGVRRAGSRAYRGPRPGAGHAPGRHQCRPVPPSGHDHTDRARWRMATSWGWATACSASRAVRSTCTGRRGRDGPGSPTTATAGSSQLQLAEATEWRAGDRLVVASTDFDPGHAEVVDGGLGAAGGR